MVCNPHFVIPPFDSLSVSTYNSASLCHPPLIWTSHTRDWWLDHLHRSWRTRVHLSVLTQNPFFYSAVCHFSEFEIAIVLSLSDPKVTLIVIPCIYVLLSFPLFPLVYPGLSFLDFSTVSLTHYTNRKSNINIDNQSVCNRSQNMGKKMSFQQNKNNIPLWFFVQLCKMLFLLFSNVITNCYSCCFYS